MIIFSECSILFLGKAGWLGVDIIDAIKTSDPVGQLCILVCAFFSIASWGIIFYKLYHIHQAHKQTQLFQEAMISGGGNLEEAFKQAADYPDSPLAQILRETYLELQIENWYREGYNLDVEGRVNVAKVELERVMERTIAQEIMYLESYLTFLATTSNVCPFIGLFGTVWGVMGAFQSLAHQGTAAIQSLAPGLSTALSATIAGLVAAIPASVCYNYLTNKIQILVTRMDSFALELSNIIQKLIFKEKV